MPASRRATASEALAKLILDLPELGAASTVAAYVSIATEPGTALLLNSMSERGVRLLVPLVLADLDLDWVPYGSPSELSQLGPEAIANADVVIAPALAVDVRGWRLGRGGGSYDRALARVAAGTPVIVPLYDGEVLPQVPAEAHDRPIRIAVTPSRTWRFP